MQASFSSYLVSVLAEHSARSQLQYGSRANTHEAQSSSNTLQCCKSILITSLLELTNNCFCRAKRTQEVPS